MPGWFNKSGSSSDPSQPSEEGSTSESARAFRHGLEDHLKARAELLSLEAREAGGWAARKGALAALVGALAFFGYALVLVAVVALLGSWIQSWPLAALALGIIHLVIALLVFLKLKRKSDHQLFEYTRAEFQKDRAWFNTNKTPPNESDSSR